MMSLIFLVLTLSRGGMAFGATCDGAAGITKPVRQATKKPLVVKLSPNVTSIAEIAKSVEAEGCRRSFTDKYSSGNEN